MPTIVFVDHHGKKIEVQADVGLSVMQSAVDAGVDGILADCGGNCSCATCHGYVDSAWLHRLPKPTVEESEMLQGVLEPRENSRLTCQIKVTADLDGIVINLPESQL